MKKVFSGVQPSGELTIGNYLGALKQFVELQDSYDCIFSIVDYHAITVDFDPEKMPQRILDTAAWFLACGIDPQKSTLFLQSDRPEHTELAWILNTVTPIGDLQRMTQFKDKSQKQPEVKAGLLNYPILMASDILIYKAEVVPVGEDQVQHVELARKIARKFNQKFGQTFPEPKTKLQKTARVLGLDGKAKMSKSNPRSSYIALGDSPEVIKEKITSAATDTGKDKQISVGSQNLINLLEIFAGPEISQKFQDQREKGVIKYSELKPVLADAIIKELTPIQKKFKELSQNSQNIKDILSKGAQKLQQPAKNTIKEVKQKLGIAI